MKIKQHSPFTVRNMIFPTFLVALALWAITPDTCAVEQDFPIAFTASQSLFQGGPSAGFDYEDSFGNGNVGIDYRAVANSGTVDASVNGS